MKLVKLSYNVFATCIYNYYYTSIYQQFSLRLRAILAVIVGLAIVYIIMLHNCTCYSNYSPLSGDLAKSWNVN